ncbi:hypothetical protein D3C87_80370 [compost metagenome]
MKYKNVDSLYGIKVGDLVRYVANDSDKYDSSVFNLCGKVIKIVAETGEFVVQSVDLTFPVSFQRVGLSLITNNDKEKIDFSGTLFDEKDLTLEEMIAYLSKYHNLIEGKDFGIYEQGEIREVILTNENYCSLIKDIISLQKVNRELGLSSSKNIAYSMKRNIGDASSLSFKLSNWVFKTHITPVAIQHAFLFMNGIDSYAELNIQKK